MHAWPVLIQTGVDTMRKLLIAPLILLGSLALPAGADVSIGFSAPGVRIGVNVPAYPRLQRIPGHPVYYAPVVNSNYFFYDGLYWVYDADNWYESTWYNGPWRTIDREYVPVYLLRVPVRYYRQAPAYFRGWRADSPPRWGDHWGDAWQQRRSGWDQWNRRSAPAAAPLPAYQSQYSGTRYPQRAQQPDIQTRNYRYQPRDAVVQQRFQQQSPAVVPLQTAPQQSAPQQSAPRQQTQRIERRIQPVPVAQAPQAPQLPAMREHPAPRQAQGKGQERERGADRDHDSERDKHQDRNQGKSKGRDKDNR
jgi:hypothetical protein